MSWGNPAHMTNGWDMDALTDDCSHVVLNDIDVKKFSYWREFLGCQMSFVVTAKWRRERTVRFGKPVIWTCNFDNDPRKVKIVGDYLKQVDIVVVEVDRPLYARKAKLDNVI